MKAETYTAADLLRTYGLPAADLATAVAEGLPEPTGKNARGGDLWNAEAIDTAIAHMETAPFAIVGRMFDRGELTAGEVPAELRTLRAIRGKLGGLK